MPQAQYALGLLYLDGEFIKRYIKKGIYLISLALKKQFKPAYFILGYFYHFKEDIENAISYYKEGSSFNDQYAKNNIAIIYIKKKETANAMVFLEEAIRQKNDILSIYNLANILIYDETIKQDIDRAIKILINSSIEFYPSFILLCIALVKKFGFDFKQIKDEIFKHENSNIIISKIFEELRIWKTHGENYLKQIEKKYKNQYFLYDYFHMHVSYSHFQKQINGDKKQSNIASISSAFYEGFGL